MHRPWIMMLCCDDGSWTTWDCFASYGMADQYAREYEKAFGNRTEVLCRW